MMTNPTLTKLYEMRLLGMLKAFEEQIASADSGQMSFEERFGLIVDREDCERRNRRFRSRIKKAKPKEQACFEDLDFSPARGIKKADILSLAGCEWVRRQQNVIISGPTGVGKTYLACALLHAACKEGFSARYVRMPRFLRAISVAKLDGSYDKFMAELARTDVILFDDLGLSKMDGEGSRDLVEVMEDGRAEEASIFGSQLEATKWDE